MSVFGWTRGGGRGLARLAPGLVAAWLAASCTTSRPAPKAALPKGVPIVMVTMREHRYEYDASAIPSGRVVFRFVNAGSVEHRPALLRLPEDLPPLDEQVRGTERRSVQPYAGVYDRLPGESGSFAVDLAAGERYGIICFARDADGSSHAQKGMNSEFRPT